MEELPAKDSAQAVFVAESIRRHWLTVLLTVIVIAGAVAGYESIRTRSYVATSTALIQPLIGNAYSEDTVSSPQNAIVALETEAQLVDSAAIATQVQEQQTTAVCRPGPAYATVLTNTQLVQVKYTSDNAVTAQTCADAYVREYLKYRRSLAVQSQQAELTRLNKEADNTAQLLTEANADARSAHPSADAASNVRLYTTRLAALQAQIGVVQGESTQPGSLVVPAVRPASAAGISPALVVLASAIGGLVLGLLLAIWRGRRNKRVASDRSTDVAGLPILATTVATRKLATGMPIPAAISDEHFRLAAVSILARTMTDRVLAVSSLTANDSVSAVSFRLARALAGAGCQIVLIDGSEQQPTLTESLEIEERAGLTELLNGTHTLESISNHVVENVTIVTAGLAFSQAGGSGPAVPRLRELVNKLRSHADIVVISTGSLTSPTGIAQLLAVDAAVLVAHDRATDYQDIVAARRIAERMNVELLGTVVIRNSKADYMPPPAASMRQAEPQRTRPARGQVTAEVRSAASEPAAGGRSPAN